MIEIPDWVPCGAARAVHLLMGQPTRPSEMTAVVLRLACDPRMKDVWRELSKRQRESYRSTDNPFHPSTLPDAVKSWGALAAGLQARAAEYRELGGESTAQACEQQAAAADARDKTHPPRAISAEEQHQLALALFFNVAISAYLDGSRTVSRREVDDVVTGLENVGKSIEAKAFRRHAADPQVARFIVARHRTDARLEAFVETIGRETAALFGSALYGVVATTANVAFERTDLDRQRIRAILKIRTPAENP